MSLICPLQQQVNFNSESYLTIPTTTNFFQWANRTNFNIKVLIYIFFHYLNMYNCIDAYCLVRKAVGRIVWH